FTADAFRAAYEGKVSAEGASIVGTWTRAQGEVENVEFVRATKDNACSLPPTHGAQFITVDNDVKLELLDWARNGKAPGSVSRPREHGAYIRQLCAQTDRRLPRVRHHASGVWQ